MSISTRPLAVGLVGLGRMGLYHLERLSLRSDMYPVAVLDADPQRAALGESSSCTVHGCQQDFLQDERIELVLVALPLAERFGPALAALASGRDVAVETPLALRQDEARALRDQAATSAARLVVLSPRLGDDDFQAARAVVAEGRIGRPTTLKHLTWDYASLGRPGDIEALLVQLAPTLEQLLLLAGTVPRAVTARELGGRQSALGLQLLLDFDADITAQVEVHPASPAPLSTGWVICGTRGGYRRFESYTVTDEHEVYPTHIEPPEIDHDQAYSGGLCQLRDEVAHAEALSRCDRVVALLDAALCSLETGQAAVLSL